MRLRVLRVAVTAVMIAVVVLGLPLAVAIARLVEGDERAELESLALRTSVDVSPATLTGDAIELPATEDGVQLGVYDTTGRRVAGTGPTVLEDGSKRALAGTSVQADFGERLVEAVPVSANEKVFAVVRTASPEGHLIKREIAWWAALLGGCLVAGLAASLFAARESRRLAAPMVKLADVARDIGEGDFSPRSEPVGVEEIDTVGGALNRTAERLAELLERERSFAGRASHQLRTPLTQLQLELEAGLVNGGEALHDAAINAVEAADRLSQTIDDLLTLARGEPSSGFDLAALALECADEWRGPLASAGRPLRVIGSEPAWVAASRPAVRQVLQVLLDNALTHGRGAVTVRVRDAMGALAVDVEDQGVVGLISLGDGGRLGLPLARSLAVANGGRIVVDQTGPGTRFTLLLLAGKPPGHEAG
jgi:signal transduction histidine kinase